MITRGRFFRQFDKLFLKKRHPLSGRVFKIPQPQEFQHRFPGGAYLLVFDKEDNDKAYAFYDWNEFEIVERDGEAITAVRIK